MFDELIKELEEALVGLEGIVFELRARQVIWGTPVDSDLMADLFQEMSNIHGQLAALKSTRR